MPQHGNVITTADFPAAQQGDQGDAGLTPPRGFKRRSEKLMGLMRAVNIAEELEKDDLSKIGRRVVDEYKIDKQSRTEWEELNAKAMDLAMQVVEPKMSPWPGASNIKFPLLTEAAIQFAARAYPAIVQGKDVVKGKVIGADDGQPVIGQDGQPVMVSDPNDPEGQPQPQWQVEPGAKRKRANRIARHMSYQLIEEMEDWEEDTDKLLHMLPIIGTVFRKTYFSREKGQNVSELIPAMKLVVNNGARSLETVPRITQEFELYPYQITERVRGELFLDVELGRPQTGNAADDDAEHLFLEQHRYIDLDEDDYPEPYIVTVHKDTAQVVRIVANYDEDSVVFNNSGEVAKIERIEYFTKYSFLPSPTGSFYDIGFGSLLYPISEAVNSTINQMLDAGHLHVAGGGFIARGARIKSGVLKFKPGEWKKADSVGGKLKDAIVPLKLPEPSLVLFQLLGLLIEAGSNISSVKDVLTGEAPRGQNTPATTTLALIEQGLQVFTAIYKRIYRAEKRELKKLFRLNQRYLPEKSYFTVLDEPEAIAQKDYNSDDVDVVPVADPSVVSSMQKMARAEFLGTFKDDPLVDPLEVRRRIFDHANIEDVDSLLVKQMPQNPELMERADKIEIEKQKLKLKEREIELKEQQAGPEAEQAKLKNDLLIAREKIEADQIIAREKINSDYAIALAKIEADGKLERIETGKSEKRKGVPAESSPVVLNLSIDAKTGTVKKHIDVKRDKKGAISGADVTETPVDG